MNKLTILLIASFVFIGCQSPSETNIIRSKIFDRTYLGNVPPPCICEYFYYSDRYTWQNFQDSCNKYSVGDTITFKK